ncbi:MAG: FAD-dependent oxidoreductase [Pseudomonadales bacterium]|nr:FAD-dependent oxidoreductase [Pseudomonadales bacterium]
MSQVGTEGNPLRVAVIGAGPAGFYTISNFAKHKELAVEIDLFDRLPTPYGLVRAGVAPDHQKDKSVTRAYAKSAEQAHVHYYGHVEYGTHLHMADLKKYYHQVIFTNGAPTDRDLGIPGEELSGSHSATSFVAWYNGHPDFADLDFDLSQENVAIVGVGNVALDVARILCKTREELLETDIADHALEALSNSKVKNVYLLGRRGPAQAAFTPPEIKEIGELADADIIVPPEEARVDDASRAQMEANPDKNVDKNVGFIEEYGQRSPTGKSKLLTIRFLVSPTEILGEDGKVSAIRIVRNEAVAGDDGSIRARATDQEEVLPVGLVFRSVGYQGVPLADVPFDERRGTIRNECGRVMTEDGEVVTGVYTAGWIKRGPSGVIGTNKTCAQETVQCMVEDLQAGKHFNPEDPDREHVRSLIHERQPDVVDFEEFGRIDAEELRRGEEANRPRVKVTSIQEMLEIVNN